MAKEKQETTKQETVEKAVELGPELTQMNGQRAPLVRVVPIEETRVDLFNPLKWTKEDIDTIRNSVCPKGIPDNEFRLFILKCQASGMNPLLGEAFCVERNIKIGGSKDQPIWGKAFVFTPGEQGMEGRADDFADYRGLRAAVVCAKDKIVIDPSEGEVSHQYNPAEDRGRILGAWAIAYRDGRKTPVEYVKIEEYMDAKNPKWASSPHTMIVKCARAAALRRAYPNKFDGIFAREELRDDADDAQTPDEAAQANRDTTDKLADRMKATAAAQQQLKQAPPSHATVDVVAQKPPAEKPKTGVQLVEDRREAVLADVLGEGPEMKPPPTQSDAVKAAGGITSSEVAKVPPAPVPTGPLLVFGQKKGLEIAKLDGPELLEMIALGESKIGSLKDPAKQLKVRECINALKKEQADREAALLVDAPTEPPRQREPGEDDDF